MNYKLALELKEAGFPQQHNTYLFHGDGEQCNWVTHYDRCIEDGQSVDAPTLSELIEACRWLEIYISLECHSNDFRAGVYKESRRFPNKMFESGKTPEEAVSRLWLKLHENDN